MSMIRLTPKDFDYDEDYVKTAEVTELGDEVYSGYGMTCAVVDDDDIEALKSGKILIFDVQDEYTIAIRWVDN